MVQAPAFWRQDGVTARLLSPFSVITRIATARRVGQHGWRAPVPVICCGNVTVGGAGKTTLVLDLMRRLVASGQTPHALLRGYKGSARKGRRVRLDDTADQVGDEALLLAAVAPTWIGADRRISAAAAVAAGASVLVMDDGLQNPTLMKDVALLVIDGASGFGNGRLLPAGPLREPVAVAAERCQAAILIGPDVTGAAAQLPPGLPILRAQLVQDRSILSLHGRRILPFAGIARPDKFFIPLAEAGAIIVEQVPFPDHHLFSRRELDHLLQRATARQADLVTTPKDAVRLPTDVRAKVTVIGVSLAWDDPAALDALIARVLTLANPTVP